MAKYNVKGMHCQSCVDLITEDLTDLGAKSVDIDLDAGTVEVELDDEKVKKTIRELGFKI